MKKIILALLCASSLFAYPYFDLLTADTTINEGDSLSFLVYAWSWQFNYLHFEMDGAQDSATLSDTGRVGGCTCSATLWAARFKYYTDIHSAGNHTIYFYTIDTLFVADTDTVVITVVNVPIAPVIIGFPESLLINEDESFAIPLSSYGSDPDSTPEALEWDAYAAHYVLAYVAGNVLYVVSTPDWNGEDTIFIMAADGTGLADTAIAIFKVAAVNDAPFFSGACPDADTLVQGDTLWLSLRNYIHDIDDSIETLTLNSWGAPDISVTQLDSFIFRICAPEDWFGQETLFISITDASGLSDTAAIQITVLSDTTDIEFKELKNPLPIIPFPNPFGNMVSFDIPSKEVVSVRIFDLSGREIHSATACEKFIWETEENSSIPLGIYFIVIDNQYENANKILKMR